MRARFLLLASLAGLLAAGPGCRRQSAAGLGAELPEAEAIDLARIGETKVLLAALGQPGARLDATLGPRHVEASASLLVNVPGLPDDKLDETWQLDADGKGGLHLLHDNSRGDGWEATVAGADLYVRPRHARFVKRRPEAGEVDRLRQGVEGVLADYLTLLRAYVTITPAGKTEAGGRSGLRIKLGAKREPDRLKPETRPERRWRDTVAVRVLDGEVVLHEPSGALLAARLEARYSFEREGKGTVENSLTYRFETSPARPIEPPADFVLTTGRPRPMLDRQALLGGAAR